MLTRKRATNKGDTLELLLQRAKLDEPSYNFTALVMAEVLVSEPATNPELTSLLKRSIIENAPIDFTENIMTAVKTGDFRTTYRPVLPVKVWRTVFLVVACFILHLYLSGPTSLSSSLVTPYVISIGNSLNAILSLVNSIPSLYQITAISVSALLVLDSLLRTRRKTRAGNSPL